MSDPIGTPQAQPPAPGAPPPSRSGPPWGKIALFGCLGLLILGLVIGAIGAVFYVATRDGEEADLENTILYQNSSQNFTGQRAENFVDFSFRYPADWQVLEDASMDVSNFIKVESRTADQFTIENFAVGHYSITMAGADLEDLIDLLEPGFSSFPNYRRTSDDRATVDGRDARGWRFTAMVTAPERGDVDIYGRVLLVPAEGGRGVVLILLASELSEVVSGPDDLGETGGLATILETFRVGDVGGASTPAPASTTGDRVVHQGVLEPGDLTQPDESWYDEYPVPLSVGDRIVATLESSAFDAYLQIRSPSGETSGDDDSGGGTNSRLEVTASEAGTWIVDANELRAGVSGPYVLTIEVTR